VVKELDKGSADHTPAGESSRGTTRGSGGYGMWIGPILPAVIWAVQMQLNYWLLRGACAGGSNIALYSAFLVAIVCVFIAGLGCWLAWMRVKEIWPNGYGGHSEEDGSSRFLAVLGLLMAGMFLIVIIAQGIATLVLSPCQS
jgi:uncharacterized iron-regulated membrane protein